ncbi:aminotransferase class V-fold PLP-dependent enzyme [Nocardia sp. NPDC052254]|uniref:pyridoxal-phosphate-dependent aminotransferase family protein n=1 Tax=Nocardia sp. NPDC052254 TaxID=3155681 RepID=UPI00342D774D
MPDNGVHLEPGPTIIDPRVVAALSAQPMYHQSPEFAVLADETCDLLRSFYGTSGEVVMLPSSGRGAVEAALASVDHIGRTLVVPANGTFARMMATIGRSLGMHVVELAHRAGQILDRDRIAEEVARHDRPILGVVHNETSTGMLNPLDGLAEVVRGRDGLLVVDTVSSLGGTAVEMDRHDIDLCASTTQKAVGAPPGVGFVALGPRGIAAVESGAEGEGHYLQLRRWWDQWVPLDRGGRLASGYRRLPWTMPTNVVVALHTALRLAAGEHVRGTWERHRRIAEALRAALRCLGASPVAAAGYESPTVSAFRFGDTDVLQLRRALAHRHGVHIATGMGDEATTVLRFAHMAESARPTPQLLMLTALTYELARSARCDGDDPAQVFQRFWFAQRPETILA